uniref:Uncharacterized protein n=1 Tax=Pseudictyota dubia TaxID=2749911 RepID=A0A7R9Z304_9STRA|mmetsp:Transcript_19340/g.36151  ORF Transcript_19340/g.36151 Transcript_19340/m.36151 type:complete len:167 (+) Transcript_19340:164-664(+)
MTTATAYAATAPSASSVADVPIVQAEVIPSETYSYGQYPNASAPLPSGSSVNVTSTTNGAKKVTTTTYTIPAPAGKSRQQYIPPGAKPGGVWMKQRYVGPKTGAATLAGCFVFFIPGLLFLCFPMDKRFVYQEPGPNGRLLKGSGRVVKGGSTPKVVPSGYRGMNA